MQSGIDTNLSGYCSKSITIGMVMKRGLFNEQGKIL